MPANFKQEDGFHAHLTVPGEHLPHIRVTPAKKSNQR